MLDPRFQERLEFIDERDEEGKPTVRAQIGLKIQGYSEDVERLRISLAELEEEVLKLQSSVEAQALSIAEQESRRTDLITDAQNAGSSCNVRKRWCGSKIAPSGTRHTRPY